ncbi:hypothetical protein AO501_34055 [Mycobacterium gordonae]|uniref:Uncharacterized protein n=1 Tax=Mycobacterium gordonae TaxID=1778 RepID=A0A0Q2QZF1_MYCGO|nr:MULTISPECIES: hypothetical protein [Mycobacterium]KQH77238.1 hypothetical protein AO501_34055 [Mycobacterium gordonae]MDP7730121.1 hypothetical protein [Mycobacterium sp. TY813]
MAARLDVVGRLAEGLPAVEHAQTYLLACEQIGYRDPDLTGDPALIHDWYAGEEGLDLPVLDGDCVALRAAGSVATDALRLLRDQLDALATAWTGSGADAAVAFLRRHCDTAGALVTEVRAAAQRCESLRDNLWQLVDAKVATTTAIDDRTLAQRPAWLAAAAAVATDAGARDVVAQQIKPFVDNDIRHEWRSAMLSTRAGVTAAYDMVTDRFAAASRAYFEIPGDFGPLDQPPRGPAAGTLPAALARFAPIPTTTAAPRSAPAPAPAPMESGTGWSGEPVGAGGLDGGVGSQGVGGLEGLGGLGSLASRIVASMGDLLGSSAPDGAPADSLSDDPFEDENDRPEPDRLEAPEEPKKPEFAPLQGEAAVPVSQPIGAARPVTGSPVTGTVPGESPPVEVPPPTPPAKGSTPCEIAANELPQAGQ